MAAAVLTGHGGLDKLEYRTDWPRPEPAAGELLVRVGACGVNNTDINTRTAWYSPAVTDGTTEAGGRAGFANVSADKGTWGGAGIAFPRIQGADIVGRVVAAGEGAAREWLGARVMVDPWLRDWNDPMNRDRAGFIGSERDGGFAQYVCVPEANAHRVEGPLADEALATFACSYVTAENMLGRARVPAGEVVLVTGASGGVGTALVQLARRRGATVIAIAAADKAERLRALGASAAIPRGTEDLESAVAAVAGAPVDVVADVVGGGAFGQLLAVLRRGGRYVVSGAIAGPMVALDLRTLYLKDLELIGATVPEPDTFGRLVGYIERGEIQPVLAKAYPLSGIREAQAEFLAKRHVGKLVLVPPR